MRKIKIFTQANRCNLFLTLWLKYYSSFIQQENIHIYYENKFNQDIEKYLINRKYNKVKVYHVDTIISLNYFNVVQEDLLKECDVLLYADPDEIIFSVDLVNILNTFTDSYLTTTGFEIVHNIGFEERYNPNKKITAQRNYGIYSDSYDKPLVLRKPLKWTCTGKHSKNVKMNKVDGLFLIHLCRFDFPTLLGLNRQNKMMYKENQSKCWHHLIVHERQLQEYYEKYFLHSLVEIPQEIKSNLSI